MTHRSVSILFLGRELPVCPSPDPLQQDTLLASLQDLAFARLFFQTALGPYPPTLVIALLFPLPADLPPSHVGLLGLLFTGPTYPEGS